MKKTSSPINSRRFALPRLLPALVAAAMLFAISGASAATILWGAATHISGDGDVKANGQYLYAYNIGGASDTTVNGVLFSAFYSAVAPKTLTVGNLTVQAHSGGAGNVVNTTEAGSVASAPYSNLSAEYQSLLGSVAWIANGGYDITLSGLTLGSTYQVQLWVNDSRGAASKTWTDVLDGSTSLMFNVTQSVGGLGQFVVGTFTADATTQSFQLLPGQSVGCYINGLSVMVVPEPNTAALVGLCVLGLAGASRIRRNRR